MDHTRTKEEELLRLPLFMKKLSARDTVGNVALEGLLELAREESNEEKFMTQKENGDEIYTKGREGYIAARTQYEGALRVWGKGIDEEALGQVYEKLAKIELELGNSRKCVRLLEEARRQGVDKYVEGGSQIEAEVRLKLGEYEKAEAALEKMRDGAKKEKMKRKIEEKKVEANKEEVKRLEWREIVESSKKRLADRIREIGVKHKGIDKLTVEGINFNGVVSRVRYNEETGETEWPVVVCVEEYMIMELIPAMSESNTLGEYLRSMYDGSAEWDKRGDYKAERISVYIGEVEVDKEMMFSKLLKGKEVDKCVEITIRVK